MYDFELFTDKTDNRFIFKERQLKMQCAKSYIIQTRKFYKDLSDSVYVNYGTINSTCGLNAGLIIITKQC